MKSLFVIATLVALLGSIGCPPVTKDKEKEEDSKEDMLPKTPYERYLKEVAAVLVKDPAMVQKLASVKNMSNLAAESGNIAEHLEFVSHNIRNKLDELKRKEVDRLNQIKKLLIQREQGTKNPNIRMPHGIPNIPRQVVEALLKSQGVDPETMDHKKLVSHIDELNADTFEVEDLRKLIRQATSDLEDIDKKRRDDFKTYELEKEALRRQKLKQMDERHRKEEEQRFEEMQKKHKEHPKLHHPGNKAQLEEVWEEDDDLDPEDFNAKTMFNLHDTDGNGVLDEQEVEALFQRELDKVYDPNAPEDDLMERYEEMNRMREHVMKEVDANQDKLISLEEFLKSTQDEEFNKDEGWDTLEEDPQFTEEELNEYLREREEKRRQQFEGHAQPGEINMPPAHDNLQFGQQQQQQQDNVQHMQQQQEQPAGHHPAMMHKPNPPHFNAQMPPHGGQFDHMAPDMRNAPRMPHHNPQQMHHDPGSFNSFQGQPMHHQGFQQQQQQGGGQFVHPNQRMPPNQMHHQQDSAGANAVKGENLGVKVPQHHAIHNNGGTKGDTTKTADDKLPAGNSHPIPAAQNPDDNRVQPETATHKQINVPHKDVPKY